MRSAEPSSAALPLLAWNSDGKIFPIWAHPRFKGQSRFTYAQARATELRLRFHQCVTSINCREIQINHFGQKLNPTDRSKPEVLHRLQSGELFSMWSTEAVEMVRVAAALTCEIILRERRKRGVVTPLMPLR